MSRSIRTRKTGAYSADSLQTVRAVTQLSDPQFVSRSSTKLPSLHAHWPGQITSTPLVCASKSLSEMLTKHWQFHQGEAVYNVNDIRERDYKWDLGETETARGEARAPSCCCSPVSSDQGHQCGVKTWSENSDNSDQCGAAEADTPCLQRSKLLNAIQWVQSETRSGCDPVTRR